MKKRKSRWYEFFLLSWKKTAIALMIWIASILLHNVVYGFFKTWFDSHGGDEAFFFIIAIIIIPLYFLISIIYTLIKKMRERK